MHCMLFAQMAFSQMNTSVAGRPGVTFPTLEINMYAQDVDNSMYLADAAVINFDNGFNANVDYMDVRKIMNVADNIAIVNGSYNLVVERRPYFNIGDTLRLSLTGLHQGQYRIEFDPSVLGTSATLPKIFDAVTQTEIAISNTDVTAINFNVTTDPASYAANRFKIVYKPTGVLPINFQSVTAKRNLNKSVTVNWSVQIEQLIHHYEIENSFDGVNFKYVGSVTANNNAPASYFYDDNAAPSKTCYYRIKTISSDGRIDYSVINKINAITVAEDQQIVVAPNPVENKTIQFVLKNVESGVYNALLFDANGKLVAQQTINYKTNALQRMAVPAAITGRYTLSIKNNKSTMSIPVIIL